MYPFSIIKSSTAKKRLKLKLGDEDESWNGKKKLFYKESRRTG